MNRALDRRQLLGAASAAGAWLLAGRHLSAEPLRRPARAKRMISLFMAGGPSHLETFDWKPVLAAREGEELPASVRLGQRLTGMSGNQATLPLVGSPFAFARHGQSGAWVSDLLPHTARVVDELCIVRSVFTEAINHDPAITFLQTGSQISGRPSLGAWLDFALGSENPDLPGFVVLVTPGKVDQPLYARLWGAGFLPSRHQGVQLRAGSEPVLYLADAPGIDRATRRRWLDARNELERVGATSAEAIAEAEAQSELAFRMQSSVPEAVDLSQESRATLELYGPDVEKPGSFARHCLLARRLVERGVRTVQLYHQGWDQHGGLPAAIRTQCAETDPACAALVTDLRQRGLLDETLVTWGGEFGRTSYSQGRFANGDFGRDHHPRCFTWWLAGGGTRAGTTWGETDDFGYNVARDGVHVHDLHATLLACFGLDHERLTYRFQGRDFRLTDVAGRVVEGLLA